MGHSGITRSLTTLAFIVAFTSVAAPARAEDSETSEVEKPAPVAPGLPTNRLLLDSKQSLRLNPIGLQSENKLLFTHRLMDSDSTLFSNTFAGGGLYMRLSPAFVAAGPMLTIQPIALFQLDLGVEGIQYFGSFDQILSYDDAHADYHDDAQDLRGDAGENYVTNGTHAFIRPTLRVKGGPVAVQSTWSIEHWNLDLQDQDTLFYEFTADMLVPNQGWTVLNDSDLLYFVKGGKAVAGLRYSRVAPRYTAANFSDGVLDETQTNTQQRLGLIAIKPVGKGAKYSGFHSQRLILILSYYLQHQYRGADNSVAHEPLSPIYFAFVYSFNSDFIKH